MATLINCQSLRVVFAGTPEFSVPALQALADSDHEVLAIFTQPDRPSGRGRKLAPSAVKHCAAELGIPVFQPASFSTASSVEILRTLRPDVLVVVAYGLLLPPTVLEVPALGCINIHGSLLPRWRGAAPIQRAILAGDEVTGITIMQMNAGLDTGPMLATETVNIDPASTAATLQGRLSLLGADMLLRVLPGWCDGTVSARVQDDSLATYASKLEKSEAVIDWTLSATQIHRKIRAFNPTPVAETSLAGSRLRIWQATKTDTDHAQQPGTVIRCDRQGLEVVAASGTLLVTELQLPGKKPISFKDFVNGRDITHCVLGDATDKEF